jgi:hypothetical protein
MKKVYVLAAIVVGLVALFVVPFAIYGDSWPYMVHQQCMRMTHSVSTCNTVVPLPG